MKENEICKLLETAQATYGYANQVTVAVEELCELGAVLSKYPRYDYHDDAMIALKDKVLEETADVLIMMKHIQMIFNIQPDELEAMMDKKLNRLQRWLTDDKSFQHTTEDRAVESTGCGGCYYWDHVDEDAPCERCHQHFLYTDKPTGGDNG